MWLVDYYLFFCFLYSYVEVSDFSVPQLIIILQELFMVSTIFKVGIIFLMVSSGAINTIVFKFQNTTYVYEGPVYKQFFHPYIQTMVMFFAEMLSLPVFFLQRYKNKQKYSERAKEAQLQGKSLTMNRALLFLPSFLDLVSSTLLFMSLNFVSASAYQMLRGGAIVTTFFYSIVLLKQKVQRHQVFGSALAFLGILVVGAINALYSSSAEDEDEGVALEIMGYILIILSLFTQGLFFTLEQKFLNKYYLEPLQVVGYEGLFGFLTYIFIVLGLCYTPCPFGQDACVFSVEGRPFIEGLAPFLNQIWQYPSLIVLTVISIVVTAMFNVAGVTITKYINALARAIADVSKTILVWIMGLVVTLWLSPTYPNLKWQKLQVMVIIFQLVGFALLVLGNLIYNKIIKVPIRRRPQNQVLLSQES